MFKLLPISLFKHKQVLFKLLTMHMVVLRDSEACELHVFTYGGNS